MKAARWTGARRPRLACMRALRRRCRAVSMYQARGRALPGGTAVVETALSLARRRESPGRAGARGPYQPGHDATLHRGRYGGQAQARRAALRRGPHGAPGEQRVRPSPLPHVPCLTLWGKAGSPAPEMHSAAGGCAGCGRTCRRHGLQPSDPGSCPGRGQRGREPCVKPHVLVSCSPWALFSQCTVTLRSSMGEGGYIPAPVRQTCATGKGLMCGAEKPDAPLTL